MTSPINMYHGFQLDSNGILHPNYCLGMGYGSRYFPLDYMSGSLTNDPRVSVELEHQELWDQFHKIGTEMIITKPGRRMFPSLKVKLSGLEAKRNYVLMLDMYPATEHRYKYQQFQWVVAGKSESLPPSPSTYMHPESPSTGAHWMGQWINFYKLKLTNNLMDRTAGHIVLNSMHKYLPRLHVLTEQEDDRESGRKWIHVATFTFPQAEFMAVTAYQNEDITRLKIQNNPFAKGFREGEQLRRDKKVAKSLKRSSDKIETCVDSSDEKRGKGSDSESEDAVIKEGQEDREISSSMSLPLRPQAITAATTSDTVSTGFGPCICQQCRLRNTMPYPPLPPSMLEAPHMLPTSLWPSPNYYPRPFHSIYYPNPYHGIVQCIYDQIPQPLYVRPPII